MLDMKRLLVYLLASVAIASGAKAQDMKSVPLTLEAVEAATTVTITNPLGLTIEYSTDGGSSWTSASANPLLWLRECNEPDQLCWLRYGYGSDG